MAFCLMKAVPRRCIRFDGFEKALKMNIIMQKTDNR
jgi:hypothetical protein